MIEAQPTPDEVDRLAALDRYHILDTEAEKDYDDLAQLASYICGTPIALISLVDEHRQWFKAKVGLIAQETSRDIAFCAHALHEEEVMIVPDALEDPRFETNPLVLGDPKIRFYAGAPLRTPDGYTLGTVCAIDRQPRSLSSDQKRALRILARQAVSLMELRIQVAERRRAEEALRAKANDLERTVAELNRSNRDLDEFAYIASHDLREPLRGINNYARFLEEDYKDILDVDGRDKLATLRNLTARMEGLISSLLFYSRAGRADMAMDETDLNLVLDTALDTLRITLEERGVKVIRHGPLPTLVCDPARIGEIFTNLIRNGIKYNRAETPTLEIGVVEGSRPACFFVKDNGIGIRERHHESIFGVFKRLHGRKKYGGGSGIGLAICRKLVERHHGKIWVDSQPGAGTTFYFTLEEAIADD